MIFTVSCSAGSADYAVRGLRLNFIANYAVRHPCCRLRAAHMGPLIDERRLLLRLLFSVLPCLAARLSRRVGGVPRALAFSFLVAVAVPASRLDGRACRRAAE